MTDFYVYIHRKATTGEIFYVGKGKENRSDDKAGRNEHWINTVKKHGFKVEVIGSGYQEWYAFELEVELIACYGRKDLGHGKLVNWTDGGEGQSNPNPDVRKRMSASAKAREASVYDCHRGENNHMKQKEYREAIALLKTGVSRPDLIGDKNPSKRQEVRAKISKSLQALTNSRLHRKVKCIETGAVFSSISGAEKWLKTTGASGDVQGCVAGYYKTAAKMHWEYV